MSCERALLLSQLCWWCAFSSGEAASFFLSLPLALARASSQHRLVSPVMTVEIPRLHSSKGFTSDWCCGNGYRGWNTGHPPAARRLHADAERAAVDRATAQILPYRPVTRSHNRIASRAAVTAQGLEAVGSRASGPREALQVLSTKP